MWIIVITLALHKMYTRLWWECLFYSFGDG